MKRVNTYVISLLLLFVAACSGDNQGDMPKPEFVPYEFHATECEHSEVSIKYQRIANADASDILANIEATNYQNSFDGYTVEPMDVEASVKLLVDEYVEGGCSCCEGTGLGYRFTMDQSVYYVREETILCYETFVESYTGGTNEAYSMWYECFDLETGQLYDFNYLFEGDHASAMRTAVYDALKTGDYELTVGSAEMLHMANSVAITDRGLLFVYQPFEVAPLDAGIISVVLTDEEIAATGAPLVWAESAE